MKTSRLKQKGISIFIPGGGTFTPIPVQPVRATAGLWTTTGSMATERFDAIGVYRSAQFLVQNNNTIGFADRVSRLGA